MVLITYRLSFNNKTGKTSHLNVKISYFNNKTKLLSNAYIDTKIK